MSDKKVLYTVRIDIPRESVDLLNQEGWIERDPGEEDRVFVHNLLMDAARAVDNKAFELKQPHNLTVLRGYGLTINIEVLPHDSVL